MKKNFPGHFQPSKREIDRLWENSLFTVDTNILLNLYRYSDSTRNEVLQILKAMKDRLWLPHRAAQEYFNNRLGVISQQEKAYEEAIKTLNTLQSDLSNARQHPFLSEKLMQKLSTVIKEVVSELGDNKDIHAKRTQGDEIQQAIGDLFNGRVGTSYSEEQLDEICKEGDDRYNRKIPPGYKDDGKDESSSPGLAKYRKYGDLIIWKQVIDKANEVKKGIIFVNDDKKEDWWLIFRGKTLGPRPELISEFIEKCSQNFYMYQADRFFEFAAEHLKQKITPASVDEIRDLSRSDLARQHKLIRLHEEEAMLRARVHEVQERMAVSSAQKEYLQKKVTEMELWKNLSYERLAASAGEDQESLDKFLEFKKNSEMAEMELSRLHHELAKSERDYMMSQQKLAEFRQAVEQRASKISATLR
ncbi:MAG: PIN domain-containing protein [Desulfuromonadaceae bacterium]|nr:PIN domain-containing protein [Desulfuromonadaceae bacterium]MDD2849131.1 PIN domain-containing protein [Desulfuromonadaceae bacterium]MDD4129499.1 PIN domain-containing protein [Desulfuromonadaceae bacterium]